MENLRIRQAAEDHGVKLWEIAEKLGIADGNFSRKLRRELPNSEQEKILVLIEEIARDEGRE